MIILYLCKNKKKLSFLGEKTKVFLIIMDYAIIERRDKCHIIG